MKASILHSSLFIVRLQGLQFRRAKEQGTETLGLARSLFPVPYLCFLPRALANAARIWKRRRILPS